MDRMKFPIAQRSKKKRITESARQCRELNSVPVILMGRSRVKSAGIKYLKKFPQSIPKRVVYGIQENFLGKRPRKLQEKAFYCAQAVDVVCRRRLNSLILPDIPIILVKWSRLMPNNPIGFGYSALDSKDLRLKFHLQPGVFVSWLSHPVFPAHAYNPL